MATPISLALLLWLLAVLLRRIGRAETRSARAGRAPTVRGSRELDPGGGGRRRACSCTRGQARTRAACAGGPVVDLRQYEHEGRAQHLLSWYGQRLGHTKVISARALLRYVEGERTFMRGDI